MPKEGQKTQAYLETEMSRAGYLECWSEKAIFESKGFRNQGDSFCKFETS